MRETSEKRRKLAALAALGGSVAALGGVMPVLVMREHARIWWVLVFVAAVTALGVLVIVKVAELKREEG